MEFTKADENLICDYVVDEHKRRKRDRSDLEKQWEEVDRQICMKPDARLRLDAHGNVDTRKAWMPIIELPLQAQTLEVLTADARRMMFPDSGPWFSSHAALTDDYLERVDLQSLITGDRNDVPTMIDQDGADKLVTGVINHWHRQYDFYANMDLINVESFSYGMGVGRARMVEKSVFANTSKGVVKGKQRIPVLFPRSIKHTYLDDSEHRLMNEGYILGPSVIFETTLRYEDLKKAAENGITDTMNENGGWMKARVREMEGDDKGNVFLLEYEGDLVVPKTGDPIVLRGVIATVAIGHSGKKEARKIVRLRFRKQPQSSYIEFPYHHERQDTPYPTSPLMKGRPLQIAAVDALVRLMMAGALDAQPPVRYSPDDANLKAKGGPVLYPGAAIESADGLDVLQIGNPAALFNTYAGILNQYFDVTGVNAPRLGAQSVSHTTAYAKDAELTRGTIRTVDYVRNSLKGGLTKWLDMAYRIGREEMKKSTVYIDAYGGFVDIDKSSLPDLVSFEAHGSGGPAEEQAKMQGRMQALQLGLQMHQMALQSGQDSGLDIRNAIEQTLREGGWTDVDILFRVEPSAEGPAANPLIQPGMGGTPGIITSNPAEI